VLREVHGLRHYRADTIHLIRGLSRQSTALSLPGMSQTACKTSFFPPPVHQYKIRPPTDLDLPTPRSPFLLPRLHFPVFFPTTLCYLDAGRKPSFFLPPHNSLKVNLTFPFERNVFSNLPRTRPDDLSCRSTLPCLLKRALLKTSALMWLFLYPNVFSLWAFS